MSSTDERARSRLVILLRDQARRLQARPRRDRTDPSARTDGRALAEMSGVWMLIAIAVAALTILLLQIF
jgi:hypothetical protein